MHSILHDWNDDNCRKILSNLVPAMNRGYSKVLINENVIPDVEAHWEAAALDAAGGEEVPATYINLADASIKMVCPPPPKPPFFLNEPWEAFEALT